MYSSVLWAFAIRVCFVNPRSSSVVRLLFLATIRLQLRIGQLIPPPLLPGHFVALQHRPQSGQNLPQFLRPLIGYSNLYWHFTPHSCCDIAAFFLYIGIFPQVFTGLFSKKLMGEFFSCLWRGYGLQQGSFKHFHPGAFLLFLLQHSPSFILTFPNIERSERSNTFQHPTPSLRCLLRTPVLYGKCKQM